MPTKLPRLRPWRESVGFLNRGLPKAYILDRTPTLRNRPHVLALTPKAHAAAISDDPGAVSNMDALGQPLSQPWTPGTRTMTLAVPVQPIRPSPPVT
ncbi:MAG TPA: hypothetical protein VMS73_10335 [Anaerolineaceae bacterium]|nr:hypothetical protein [Anaerolineaceae bacterium]